MRSFKWGTTLVYWINVYTCLSFWQFFSSIHALIWYYMIIKSSYFFLPYMIIRFTFKDSFQKVLINVWMYKQFSDTKPVFPFLKKNHTLHFFLFLWNIPIYMFNIAEMIINFSRKVHPTCLFKLSTRLFGTQE